MDWDFYLYLAMTVLRWDINFFWNVTPAHLIKQYIVHIEAHDPKAFDNVPKKVYLDETPFI